MKRIIVTVIVSVITIIFLLGFIDRSSFEEVKSTADITYSISTMPNDLKAVGVLNKREQDIICATSRGLVEVDENNKIIPALADSVDLREDGIEYDFKINKEAVWSDGSKITPKDIVLFFREIITNENESDISAILNVFGAREFRDSNESFNDRVGITATEDGVIIRLNTPDPNFLLELSKPQYRLRKNVLMWDDISNSYNKLIYSGDYSINSVENSQIILSRNLRADVKLAQTIHIVKDEGEDLALAAFEVGTRDIVIDPPKSQLQRLSSEGKLLTMSSNRGMYALFNYNNDNIPLVGKRELYRDLIKAIEEYQLQNKSSIELADGNYFRNEQEDLDKLQARKVMSNNLEEWQKPEIVSIIAIENLENKELLTYLTEWFDKNSDIYIQGTLLKEDEMNQIKDKMYYDIALIDIDSAVRNSDGFYKELEKYLPSKISDNISRYEGSKEEIFSEIENTLFENYIFLPVAFYNDNIAINSKIDNVILDGNGNLTFKIIKNN